MGSRAAAVDVWSALADPTRRRLLDRLSGGERPVKTLADDFDVTLSAVSQHLRVLRQVGLVEERRAGRERWYRVNARPLRQVARWVARYERFWNERLDALSRHLAAEDQRANRRKP